MSTELTYGPLPPAWREPWLEGLRPPQLQAAVDYAKERLSLDAPDEPSAISNRLHNDLDELVELIEREATTLPARLGPANAALAIGLWLSRVAHAGRSQVSIIEREPVGSQLGEGAYAVKAAFGRTAVGSSLLSTAPAAAAPLLQGNTDDDSVLMACLAATDDSLPAEVAEPIFEICVREVGRSPLIRSPDTRLRVLSAVARHARSSEDWRVVTLTRQMVLEFPHAPLTLRGLSDVAVVASAHRRFNTALRALDLLDSLLPEVRWPADRDPQVEVAEWRYQNDLSRTAVYRRNAEDEVLHGRRLASVAAADSLLEECLASVYDLPGFDGVTSSVGDADIGYVTRAQLRRAELRTVTAHAVAVDRSRDRDTVVRMIHLARESVKQAGALAQQYGDGTFEPLILQAKLQLATAVIQGDPDVSADASRRLIRAGWPLERSNLPIFIALKEVNTGNLSSALTPRMRTAARAAIAAGRELADHTVVTYRVSSGQRGRQLAASR